jgi:protein SCO1
MRVFQKRSTLHLVKTNTTGRWLIPVQSEKCNVQSVRVSGLRRGSASERLEASRGTTRRQVALGFGLLAAGGIAGCAVPAPLPWQTQMSFNGGVFDEPVPLPEFSMQRAGGGRFTTADTRGRVSLFFFGYTTCPDVCPLTLAYIKQIRQQLGASGARVDAYFVTVDPERDTPQKLLEYVAHFDTAIVPLTGSAEELAQAQRAFGAVVQRREAPESAAKYFMDHTAVVYVVDGSSKLRLVFPHGMKPEQMAADVKRLVTMQGA